MFRVLRHSKSSNHISRTLSSATLSSAALGKGTAAYETLTKNWAESETLRPDGMTLTNPSNLAELQVAVRGASALRVVGSAHSFNDISVCDVGKEATLLATQFLSTIHNVELCYHWQNNFYWLYS